MPSNPTCPICVSVFAYPDGNRPVCPDCGHEWTPGEQPPELVDTHTVLDANGPELQDGDTVVLIQGLKVKGFAHDLKKGTKVKHIRILPGEEHINGFRIPDFGPMALTYQYGKKHNVSLMTP